MTASIPSADLVDALPYIDQGYDEPGVKEAVLAMIEEEAQRKRGSKSTIDALEAPDLHTFETELMKKEMASIDSIRRYREDKKSRLDDNRYRLRTPNNDTETAWARTLDHSKVLYIDQSIKLTNLELMNKYGAETWKRYNENLSNMLDECQKNLLDLKKQIHVINLERKKSQTDAGQKLKLLEAEWVDLVTKNFEIERAISELNRNAP